MWHHLRGWFFQCPSCWPSPPSGLPLHPDPSLKYWTWQSESLDTISMARWRQQITPNMPTICAWHRDCKHSPRFFKGSAAASVLQQPSCWRMEILWHFPWTQTVCITKSFKISEISISSYKRFLFEELWTRRCGSLLSHTCDPKARVWSFQKLRAWWHPRRLKAAGNMDKYTTLKIFYGCWAINLGIHDTTQGENFKLLYSLPSLETLRPS